MLNKNHYQRYVLSLLLILIFSTAILVRFYKLDTIPKGALVDEASYGYIAYSLLHTGKDERGVTMPLHFQAFGDEKLPAYAYTLIPVIKAFGLDNFSTRLPSALAGALLVLVMYGLLRSMDFTEGQSLFGSLWQLYPRGPSC
jgi:4-amino-4-deoxy-L-arabinose transferase-like glycosyltransferase